MRFARLKAYAVARERVMPGVRPSFVECYSSEDQVLPVDVAAFLSTFNRWASAQPDIEAVALVGSYCGAATEGSDVDLVILTSNVDRYLRDRSWVSLFGEATDCREEDYGRVTSVRAFYVGGLEVEYGFTTPDCRRTCRCGHVACGNGRDESGVRPAGCRRQDAAEDTIEQGVN